MSPQRLPAGFEQRRQGRDRLLVRRDVAAEMARLLPLFMGLKQVPGARVLAGGRGVTVSVALGGGVHAVVRRSLRGGLPARFVRDIYFGARPRPFAEIAAGERLRAAGLPVPEGLGAVVRRVAPFCYRGAVATREIEASSNLWHYLEAMPAAADRRRACAAAGRVVRALHDAGALHPDLNLQNFLVQQGEGDEPRLWLIDLDGVRFAAAGAGARRAARERLARSCRRLDPTGAVVEPAWFEL